MHSIVLKYGPMLSIVLLSASLFTAGLVQFEVLGLSATSWDIAVAFLGTVGLYVYLTKHRSRPRIPRTASILGAAFLIWVLIAAARSPQEVRGLTLVGLLMRDYVMVWALVVLFKDSISLRNFNRALFATGALMALIAIVLYLPNSDTTGVRRPFGGNVLLIDEFQTPRLIGLGGDPNFFALAALSVVFFWFTFEPTRKNLLVWPALSVILMAIYLTFSRAGYAALLAGLLVLIGVQISQRFFNLQRTAILKILSFIVIAGMTFALISQLNVAGDRTVWNVTVERFDRIESSPRFALWNELLGSSTKNESSSNPAQDITTNDPDQSESGIGSLAAPTPTPGLNSANPESAFGTPTEASTQPMPTASSSPSVNITPTQESVEQPPTPASVFTGTENRQEADRQIADNQDDALLSRIFGDGLRANEERLGTYSHNSYLDVFQEMGVVGTLLWGAIAAYVAWNLIKRARSDAQAIPWIPALAVTLVMMATLSMLFMPYFWIITAVALNFARLSDFNTKDPPLPGPDGLPDVRG